jgi:hypothetical protein
VRAVGQDPFVEKQHGAHRTLKSRDGAS